MREKKEKNKVEDAKQVMDSEIKNSKSQISDVGENMQFVG